MKTKTMKLVSFILLLLSMNLSFVACSNTPDLPNNELEEKDHESPAKAELVLVEGHLHGKYGFHQNPEMEGVKYLHRIQKITFALTDKGWGITPDSDQQFRVKSALKGSDGWVVYGLWINYYNAKGELMTHEFIENGQDAIHQHFFIPRDVVPTFDGVVEADDSNTTNLFDYVYCDTNPWNKNMHNEGAKLTGDKNPVGFKGYFKFDKTRKQFSLSVELMHAAKTKFDDKGQASPFHSPSKLQRQRDHWDVKIKVPVVIYANQMEAIEAENDTPESEISVDDMKLLNSIAGAYGITWREALADLNTQIWGDVSPESGSMWF